MVFSWSFVHPKMFDQEYELRNIGISQRREIQDYLSNFLDLGKFIQIKDKIRFWCQKTKAKSVKISRSDCSRINSWQTFIATLLDLAENAS